MPELPEVETIKKDLEKNIIGQKISDVNFLWSGILKGISEAEFKQKIIGKEIVAVERRAKNLNIKLNGKDLNLLFHMKMTGHLILTDDSWQVGTDGKWVVKDHTESPLVDPLNQFIRAVFYLSGHEILAFSDLRKFAYIKLLTDEEIKKAFAEYGPEPFSKDFTKEYLAKIFENKNIAIKKVLMDQKAIAGIGNIYADEILWEARVHPLKKAKDLSSKEVAEIYKAILKILKKAVELRGTSTSDFRDTEGKKGKYGDARKVYRRTGEPCPRDGTPIQRISVGGRGTHFCPTDQKLN